MLNTSVSLWNCQEERNGNLNEEGKKKKKTPRLILTELTFLPLSGMQGVTFLSPLWGFPSIFLNSVFITISFFPPLSPPLFTSQAVWLLFPSLFEEEQ